MTTPSATAPRRRIARPWAVGGAVAGLLVGGAVATAPAATPDPRGAPVAIVLGFVSADGASCTVELRPAVRDADPAAWSIVRSHLTTAEAPAVDILSLVEAGATGEAEIAILTQNLSRSAEQEILRRLGRPAEVTILSDYSCGAASVAGDGYAAVPPVVGDDFGRGPTLVAGRPPDVVGFFRASTGQVCEIQLKVDPDWGSGATDDDGAVTARAFLATIDFTRVDFSAALRDLADFWPDDHDPAAAEASALAQTLTRQAHASFDTTHTASLPIRVESWTRCDPAVDE